MLSPDDRKLINGVSISDGVALSGGALTKQRTVTYKVDSQGPFSFSMPIANFTQAAVEDEWAKEIATLRALKVI